MQKDSKVARKKVATAKPPQPSRKTPAVEKGGRAQAKSSVTPSGPPRRAIFIDVENTSSEAALLGALGAVAEGRPRRSRRGGRRRRGGAQPPAPWGPGAVPSAEVSARTTRPPLSDVGATGVATNGIDKDIQGATPEQIIATIARLTAKAPERGVNLDLLINALKAEGFGRPPGSPRLVTRLRKMKDVEVSPTGMVRLVSLPPGPIPMELPVEHARGPSPVSASAETSAAAPKPSKRPRRRGGRGRRRPKTTPP